MPRNYRKCIAAALWPLIGSAFIAHASEPTASPSSEFRETTAPLANQVAMLESRHKQPASPTRPGARAYSKPAIEQANNPVRARAMEDLSAALTRYRKLAAEGGWPEIPAGPLLELGAEDARVVTVRKRLQVTGDLPAEQVSIEQPPSATADADQISDLDRVFDDHVDAAVKAFQKRHGLEPDGRIGPQTLRALNRSAEDKVRTLELNIARWQRLPETGADAFIFVNIPEYRLRIHQRNEVVHSARVVVGKRRHQTPEMTDSLEYMVVNPYWHIPTSIATREIVPKLLVSPEYLTQQHMEVVGDAGTIAADSIAWDSFQDVTTLPFRLRQKPGAHNALGRIKFIFPNAYSVYIHDTPSKALFDTPRRAYSHGCVRVEDPEELAAAILALQPDAGRHDIDAALANGQTSKVSLSAPLAVQIVYLTARVDADTTYFYDDIYRKDARDRASFGLDDPSHMDPTTPKTMDDADPQLLAGGVAAAR